MILLPKILAMNRLLLNLSMSNIKISCLKWGSLYGPEYVNRTYGGLLKHCKEPFHFVCYTDDADGICSQIEVKDIEELRPYNTKMVFTYEKLMLIDKDEYDKNLWIDLDVLVHEDITDLITRPHNNITFIWNYWNDYERMSLFNYGRGVSCHTNSSFVAWDKGTARWLSEYTHKHWKKIEWTYKSLDKYLFYQHHRNGRINLWEDGIFSNFNKQGYQLKNSVTLFNTSHLYNNKNMKDIRHFELHESSASELWKSYSTGL